MSKDIYDFFGNLSPETVFGLALLIVVLLSMGRLLCFFVCLIHLIGGLW